MDQWMDEKKKEECMIIKPWQGFPLGKICISHLATGYLYLVASANFWSPVGYWGFFGRQCQFLVAKMLLPGSVIYHLHLYL